MGMAEPVRVGLYNGESAPFPICVRRRRRSEVFATRTEDCVGQQCFNQLHRSSIESLPDYRNLPEFLSRWSASRSRRVTEHELSHPIFTRFHILRPTSKMS